MQHQLSANCGNLDDVLAASVKGDVITLNGMCTSTDAPAGYVFRTNPPVTDGHSASEEIWIQGDSSNGADGFDGTGMTARVLTGVDTGNVRVLNLTFQDSTSTGDGGAINVTGISQLGVHDSIFTNNHSSERGGAIFFDGSATTDLFGGFSIQTSTFGSETTPALGNSATKTGGAVSAIGNNLTNDGAGGNTFANNKSGESGGALYVKPESSGQINMSMDGNRFVLNQAHNSGGAVHMDDVGIGRLTQNRFIGNSVEPQTGVTDVAADHFGGGALVKASIPDQDGNIFDGNSVKPFTNGHDYGGGGEWIIANHAGSRNDQFINNTVAGQPVTTGSEATEQITTLFDSEGGGLGWASVGDDAHFDGINMAVAANSVGNRGEGGGIYSGVVACGGSTCFPELNLLQATVVNNTVGTDGFGSGLGGGAGGDEVHLKNSIVFGNTGSVNEISGFAGGVFSDYTDYCGASQPGGIGNMCANPLLLDPAHGNVHQTGPSPTIDKGFDDYFFAIGEFDVDYEGDLRPTDGDGDGHTVDMGADETPAFTPPPPPVIVPGPTPAQCSDGADNDGDGTRDAQDPGCLSGPGGAYNAADNNEADESARDLVLCGRRDISLVRADAVGKKVVLTGLVSSKLAGKSVQIFADLGKGAKKIATVKPDALGQFTAKVKRPSKKLFAKARYSARVDKAKSIELKLPQSLASSSVKQVGSQLELRGQVQKNLLGKKRNEVIVRRLVCGRYQNVGSAKPDKNGKYVVKFKAPTLAGAALYRAESMVLAKPGSKRYVKQFARAIGLAITGATG